MLAILMTVGMAFLWLPVMMAVFSLRHYRNFFPFYFKMHSTCFFQYFEHIGSIGIPGHFYMKFFIYFFCVHYFHIIPAGKFTHQLFNICSVKNKPAILPGQDFFRVNCRNDLYIFFYYRLLPG